MTPGDPHQSPPPSASPPEASEQDLSARFEALATEAVDPLRRYLARRTDSATAEDVLSETLLVCWRRAGDIPADAAVAWAIGVARWCLANAERAGRRRGLLARRVASVDPPVQHLPGPGQSTPEQDAADHAAATVAAAMSRLNAKDAEVVRLWAWEQLTPTQIAVVLGTSVNAATVRLHRAKKKLRTHLEAVS
ncbi:RNA polymerase sigma factor [Kineococcus sp. TBRC 1896]|uniref:RNA polymerase sigma factor n=1 Tax=Kineococcus mangrovi TaxID=1660183 RepID=A0ABV4I137_9ACTN